LTNAPLWFDEAVEFWYSKVMIGKVPYSDLTNMYQRILDTFQPPLYNFLMYFWLKISESEWWFRFFGVVCGLFANIAIYKSVKKLCKNVYIASGAVFFSSCVYQLVYYWQECAEYCLMLGTFCWTIYFFLCVIEERTTKNIIIFTISAIIPVYSQYGAAFPIAVMVCAVFGVVLMSSNKKSIMTIMVSYLTAFFAAAVPLYAFFLKKQMESQHGGEVSIGTLDFKGGVVRDF
jgi:hypothetical protein